MAVPKLTYTPVTPARGGLVHAVSLRSPEVRTECGRSAAGWIVTRRLDGRLTCDDCKLAIHMDSRGR